MTRRSAEARPTASESESSTGASVMVVGAGWRFTSGISYYTCRLSNALSESTPTSALLMRQLVPTRLYPGRGRVGKSVNALSYLPTVPVFDGVDWYWGKSMRDARRFISENRPDVLVLQWWTGAVLHSYLRLASLVRAYGGKVVIEWHEVQDTGEARVFGVSRYVETVMKFLLRRVEGHVVHSGYDLQLLRQTYDLPDEHVVLAAHGPYDHHESAASAEELTRRDGDFVFLYFGVIRPYKGVEDLVAAFDLLPEEVRNSSRLVIVGEPWEGWTLPLEAVAASPNGDRITLVDRYVDDAEVSAHFAAADAVVLPYRRSSSSGPLHIAMSSGLPVVVSSVGGLVEAAANYAGATFVPPADPSSLATALAGLTLTRGDRFADPHSWSVTVAAYDDLFRRIGAPAMRSLSGIPARASSAE